MGIRDHGYYGYAFVGARPCQIIALCAVVGMTGNFINDNNHAHISIPSQILGTLVISCIALLWTLLSFTAYDDTHFPYYATSIVDLLLVIPFIVVAGVLGAPLGSVTCSAISGASSTTSSGSVLAIQVSGSPGSTSPSSYMLFAGDNQTTCFALMAVWGLTIALAILFALSGFATGLLFLGQRRASAAAAAAAEAEARDGSRPPTSMSPVQRSGSGSGSGSFGSHPSPRYLNDMHDVEASRQWHEAKDDDEYEEEEKVEAEQEYNASRYRPSPGQYPAPPAPAGRTLVPRFAAADDRE